MISLPEDGIFSAESKLLDAGQCVLDGSLHNAKCYMSLSSEQSMKTLQIFLFDTVCHFEE
jgi:hypothetical protein